MPSTSIPTGVLSSTAAKVAVAVAFLAIGGVAAAQMGAFGGVMDTSTHQAVDQVPDDVDSVASFDPAVLERDVTDRLYVTAYNATVRPSEAPANETETGEDGEEDFGDDDEVTTSPVEMVPTNLTAAFDSAENETGLDPRAAEDVVFFNRQRENFTQPRYAGAIVHADWEKDEVREAVENNTDKEYVNTTVNGAIVYQPAESENESEEERTFGPPEPEQWVAVLGDGEYVFGTEQAVNDTIAVEYGDAEALDGDLREAYDDTRDGYVRYAQRSQNVNVTRVNRTLGRQTGLNVTAYAEAYNGLYITSGSYYITDDGDALGFQSKTLTNSTDTARDVADLTQGFISIQAGAIQNETIEEQLRATEVTREDTTVTVTREVPVDVAEKLIRWFGAAIQPDDRRGSAAAQPIA
ncbi:MAG: hypothetical protein ABEI39_05615 [Halobacteriales archaeon]